MLEPKLLEKCQVFEAESDTHTGSQRRERLEPREKGRNERNLESPVALLPAPSFNANRPSGGLRSSQKPLPQAREEPGQGLSNHLDKHIRSGLGVQTPGSKPTGVGGGPSKAWQVTKVGERVWVIP